MTPEQEIKVVSLLRRTVIAAGNGLELNAESELVKQARDFLDELEGEE